MAFSIIMFILVLLTVYPYLQEVLGKGIGPSMLGKLIFYASGRVALLAMPIGILTAALMTFGGLGENNELAAMKSTGISLFKIMRSAVFLALLIGVWALWFSFYVVPDANLKFFSLFYDMQRKKADVALAPGFFYDEIPDYVIYITDKDKETGTLYNIKIYNHLDDKNNNNHARDKGNTDIIIADSAKMFMEGLTMKMHLFDGKRYEELKPETGEMDKVPFARTYFDSLIYSIDLRGKGFEFDRTDENQFRHQIIMKQDELVTAIDSLKGVTVKTQKRNFKQVGRYTRIDSSFFTYQRDTSKGHFVLNSVDLDKDDKLVDCYPEFRSKTIYKRALANARSVKSYVEFMSTKKRNQEMNQNRYEFEYHHRFSLPVNCLIFMLIGISLGAIIRKGGFGIPAIVSLVMFVAFYITHTWGYRLAKENAIEGWIGAWLPIIVFGPIAIYTTIQATTETSLFSESFWQMWRDRILDFFSFSKQKSNYEAAELKPTEGRKEETANDSFDNEGSPSQKGED